MRLLMQILALCKPDATQTTSFRHSCKTSFKKMHVMLFAMQKRQQIECSFAIFSRRANLQ
jgi:putative lipoic acid-binding regulatory protein